MFHKSKSFKQSLEFQVFKFPSVEKKWEGEEHRIKAYLQAFMVKQ
jgi:hypothetical protein